MTFQRFDDGFKVLGLHALRITMIHGQYAAKIIRELLLAVQFLPSNHRPCHATCQLLPAGRMLGSMFLHVFPVLALRSCLCLLSLRFPYRPLPPPPDLPLPLSWLHPPVSELHVSDHQSDARCLVLQQLKHSPTNLGLPFCRPWNTRCLVRYQMHPRPCAERNLSNLCPILTAVNSINFLLLGFIRILPHLIQDQMIL